MKIEKPAGNHHPFCEYKYERAMKSHKDWKCYCGHLRQYDVWRKTHKITKDDIDKFEDKS